MGSDSLGVWDRRITNRFNRFNGTSHSVTWWSRIPTTTRARRAAGAISRWRRTSKTGRTLDELKGYVDAHPEMKRALYVVPKTGGVVGKAANFVLHVAARMEKDGREASRHAA